MDATNLSWIAAFGASAIWWNVTSGLIVFHEQKQTEVCRSLAQELLGKLFLINLADTTTDDFMNGLKTHNLQIATIPNIAMNIKIERAYIIGGLVSAFTLAFIPIFIEGAINVGKQPNEARAVCNLISLFSIGIAFCCILWTFYMAVSFNAWESMREAAQWEKIVELLSRRRG